MKKIIYLSLVINLIYFAACKKSTKAETTTVIHQLDTVEIIKKPINVVALDYASLENLDKLGINVSGTIKNRLPSYLVKYNNDSIADLGTLFEVDFKKLKQLKPDVIFMSARMKSNFNKLNSIAPTVFLTVDKNNMLSSFRNNLAVYGKIFDVDEKTNKIATTFHLKIDSLRKKTLILDKTALFVMLNNKKIKAFGKNTRYSNILHEMFGFKYAINNLETSHKGKEVSSNFILKTNPDYLFVLDRDAAIKNKSINKNKIETDTLLQQTKACKNKKIIYVHPEAWYLSGDGITSFNIIIDEVNESL